MSYRYALAEHGRTLATRPLGEALRADLAEKAGDGKVVDLDFSGVASTSHSFADEFVACLAEQIKLGEANFEIHICGASPDVERVVLKALERRSVDLPVLA
jgi:hypothetical protein